MKTHIRLFLPALLCLTLVVGIALPAVTPDAGAGTSDTVISPLGKDGLTKRTQFGMPFSPMPFNPAAIRLVAIDPAAIDPATIRPMPFAPAAIRPIPFDPSVISPAVISPTAVDQTAIDSTAIPSTAIPPTVIPPTVIDPAAIRPTAIDPANTDPVAPKAAVSDAKQSNSKPKPAVSIWVNNVQVSLDSTPLLLKATTYVPLYDFCRLMGSAAMTQDENSTTIFLPDLQIEAIADNYYIIANGRYLYAPTLCKMVNNVMYVPIRPLVKAFGSAISWDQPSRTVYISPDYEPIEHGDTFYDKTDLHWLSRIISAEARGESMDGKIAVGNVVLNRVRSESFPATVRGVIFDRRSGVQFSPAYSGAINRTPDSSCVIAAKLALDGANVVGDSLYFNASRLRRTWASRNRTFVATIGNHTFYA